MCGGVGEEGGEQGVRRGCVEGWGKRVGEQGVWRGLGECEEWRHSRQLPDATGCACVARTWCESYDVYLNKCVCSRTSTHQQDNKLRIQRNTCSRAI